MAETAVSSFIGACKSRLSILRVRGEIWRYLGDSHLVAFSVLIATLIYASELTSFTLSIDEELGSYDSADVAAWRVQGRWGMSLLCLLLPTFSAIPFVATFLFVLGLSLSGLMFAGLLTRTREEAFAFVAIFVGSPIWLHIAEFNSLSWGVAVGLVAIAYGTGLLLAGGLVSATLAGLFVAFGIGIYQTLILVFLAAAIVAVTPTHAFCAGGRRWKWSRFWDLVACTAVAVSAYLLVNWLAMSIAGLQLVYFDNYFRLIEFTDERQVAMAIDRTLSRMNGFLLGTDPTFLEWGAAILLLPWVGFCSGLVSTFRRDSGSVLQRAVGIAAIFIVGVLALSPVIVSAGRIPTRVLVCLPLLYAILAANAFRLPNFSVATPQRIALAFATIVSMWIASSLFYADALARDRDGVLAVQLIERIETEGRHRFGEVIPIVVFGQWTHEVAGSARRVEIFGSSFFEHDGGNVFRIENYLRLKGGVGLAGQPITVIRPFLAEVQQMPSWPAQGSVAIVDQFVVIKFGPASYSQQVRLER